MVDISAASDPPSLEELKSQCRDKIARMFAEKLPDVAQGMIDLALTSEIDSVRFRAQNRILNEFQQFQQKQLPVAGTNVQIINAMPFERAAYEKNRELEQVDVGNLRVATPRYKQITPIGDDKETTSREQFAEGRRESKERVDARTMKDLGKNRYEPIPADLVVPPK
jgi:hypothetical protein